VRDIVKRGKADLKQRLVPAAAVAQWQGRVEKAEPDVTEVRLINVLLLGWGRVGWGRGWGV